MVTGQVINLTWKKVTFSSKWVVTTLIALLKSCLCATQLYIRSDTSSKGTRLGDALLQICIGNGDVDDDGDQNDDEARGDVLLQVIVIKIIIPSVEKMEMKILMMMVIRKMDRTGDPLRQFNVISIKEEDDNGVDDEDDNQNDHVDDYNAFFSQGCEPFPSCCTCGQEQK